MNKKTPVSRRKPLDSPGDIHNQINVVVNEIQSFSSRITTLQAKSDPIHDGFDLYSSLYSRESLLATQIHPGKPLSAPSLLLMYGVLQAVQSGPHTERAIKDSIIALFKAYGLKISNRAVFAGTNLDVPSVCAMFHSMGVLSPVTTNTEKETEATHKDHQKELLFFFKTKFDQAYQDFLSSTSAASALSLQNRTNHNQHTKKAALALLSAPIPPLTTATTVDEVKQDQVVEEEEEEAQMMGEVVDMLLMDQPPSHNNNVNNGHDDSLLATAEEGEETERQAMDSKDDNENEDETIEAEQSFVENIEDDESDDDQPQEDSSPSEENNNQKEKQEKDVVDETIEYSMGLLVDKPQLDDPLLQVEGQETAVVNQQAEPSSLPRTISDSMNIAPAPAPAPAVGASSQSKSKKSSSSAAQVAASPRIWRLTSISTTTSRNANNNSILNAFLALVLGSSESKGCLDEWKELGYARSVSLELEEKMIRRLLSLAYSNTAVDNSDDSKDDLLEMEVGDENKEQQQLLQPLAIQPYRLGTRYLTSNSNNNNGYSSYDAPSSSSSSSRLGGYESYGPYLGHLSSSGGHSHNYDRSDNAATVGVSASMGANGGQPGRDVLDTSITITASFLLDKVQRSRRQRGRSLPSHANPSSLLGYGHNSAGGGATQTSTSTTPAVGGGGIGGTGAGPHVCAFSNYHLQLHRIVSKKTSLSFFLHDHANNDSQQQQFYPPNKRIKSVGSGSSGGNTAVHEQPTFAEFLRLSTGYASLYFHHPSSTIAIDPSSSVHGHVLDDNSNNGNSLSYNNYQYFLSHVNFHQIALTNHQTIFNNSSMIVSMVRRYPPPAQLAPPFPPQYSSYYNSHQANSSVQSRRGSGSGNDNNHSFCSLSTDNINQSIANGELWVGPVAMADLLISTNELPWRSIVPEFATLDAFDDNANVQHVDNNEESSKHKKQRNRADSTDAYQPLSSSTASQGQHVDKKRRFSVGSSNQQQFQQQMVVDVMAPSFVLLPTSPSAATTVTAVTSLADASAPSVQVKQERYGTYQPQQEYPTPTEAHQASQYAAGHHPPPDSPSNNGNTYGAGINSSSNGGRSPRNSPSPSLPSSSLPLTLISEEAKHKHQDHTTTAAKIVTEIEAEEQQTDEEDISDEACLARHERVLQAMREKWAKMSRLRLSLSSTTGNVDGKGKPMTGGQGHGQQRPRKNSEGSASSSANKYHARPYQPSSITTELGASSSTNAGSEEDMLMMEAFTMPRGGYGGHSQRQAPSAYCYLQQQQDYSQGGGHSSADEAGSHGSLGMPKKRGRPPKQHPPQQHQHQHQQQQPLQYEPIVPAVEESPVIEDFLAEQEQHKQE